MDTEDREFKLKAVGVAAGVFAQMTTRFTVTPEVGNSYIREQPRGMKDFRESVDAVFKAVGIKEVTWGK